MTEPTPDANTSWVGRKPPPPVTCNKPTGLCGYIFCEREGRCLQAPAGKPKAEGETA
jgi:hypothetical protein